MKKVIQVDKIDQAKVDEIKSAHEDLSKSKDKEKILHLDLTETTGNTELASKASETMHSDVNVIPETEASGDLDASGTTLFAAGHHRTAKPNTRFILNEGDPYTPETNAEDLEGIDSTVFHLMVEMGCTKPKVLEKMKSGEKFSAAAAKKMNLVHEISGFKNAFAPSKGISRKGRRKNSDVTIQNVGADDIKENNSTNGSSQNPDHLIDKQETSYRGKSNDRKRSVRGRKTN